MSCQFRCFAPRLGFVEQAFHYLLRDLALVCKGLDDLRLCHSGSPVSAYADELVVPEHSHKEMFEHGNADDNAERMEGLVTARRRRGPILW